MTLHNAPAAQLTGAGVVVLRVWAFAVRRVTRIFFFYDSQANEWNFCACKSYGSTVDNGPTPIWDELFRTLSAADVYGKACCYAQPPTHPPTRSLAHEACCLACELPG